jgi:hypothetical protein
MRRALLLVLSACGAPAAPPPAPTAAAVEHHDAAVDPPPPGRPSAPAPQARAPRPATASDADGLRPLDDAEAEELKKGCEKFLGALEAAGRTRSPAGRVAATEVMLDLLADPPRVDGVDLPRCTELVRRDLEIYRARTMESEAIQALRMIAIALQRADSPEAMCAAAPAVPADVARIEKGARLHHHGGRLAGRRLALHRLRLRRHAAALAARDARRRRRRLRDRRARLPGARRRRDRAVPPGEARRDRARRGDAALRSRSRMGPLHAPCRA